MSDVKTWVSWNPEWAPHVQGRYHRERVVDIATGMPEAQRVECMCTVCGAKWQTDCTSGATRSHISRFAGVHLHRDALGSPPPHLVGR